MVHYTTVLTFRCLRFRIEEVMIGTSEPVESLGGILGKDLLSQSRHLTFTIIHELGTPNHRITSRIVDPRLSS